MIRSLNQWFARTQAAIAPQATQGREVTPAAGYSLLELERAGISEEQAAALELGIDRQRESALGSNVLQLEKLRAIQGWPRRR